MRALKEIYLNYNEGYRHYSFLLYIYKYKFCCSFLWLHFSLKNKLLIDLLTEWPIDQLIDLHAPLINDPIQR